LYPVPASLITRRINLQKAEGGGAKPYQARQLLKAIDFKTALEAGMRK
jgi:hypothetical protein